MELRNKLERAIQRSEKAYSHYGEEKRYYQALRIKNANVEIYDLLCTLLYQCEEEEVEFVMDYIFHLEDWFHQFEDLEKSNPKLDSPFIFSRFNKAFPYPRDFKTRLVRR